MNLHGSIIELQNTLVQLYLKLEHRFRENGLIRDLWNAMAHDLLHQISSLKALPPSFWNQLKKDPDGLFEEAIESARHQITVKTEDLPLRDCFELALCLEEPTILKIYVPIVRSLRENRTDPALDFYIMVKAHLARIIRVIESFSGNPIVIQRSNLLLQSFEKGVQEPAAGIEPPERKPRAGRHAREWKPGEKQQKAARRPRLLAQRAKIRRNRTKPLVKKVNLQRRRARR